MPPLPPLAELDQDTSLSSTADAAGISSALPPLQDSEPLAYVVLDALHHVPADLASRMMKSLRLSEQRANRTEFLVMQLQERLENLCGSTGLKASALGEQGLHRGDGSEGKWGAPGRREPPAELSAPSSAAFVSLTPSVPRRAPHEQEEAFVATAAAAAGTVGEPGHFAPWVQRGIRRLLVSCAILVLFVLILALAGAATGASEWADSSIQEGYTTVMESAPSTTTLPRQCPVERSPSAVTPAKSPTELLNRINSQAEQIARLEAELRVARIKRDSCSGCLLQHGASDGCPEALVARYDLLE